MPFSTMLAVVLAAVSQVTTPLPQTAHQSSGIRVGRIYPALPENSSSANREDQMNAQLSTNPKITAYAQSPVNIIDSEAVVVPTLNLVPFRFNKEYSRVPRRMVVMNSGKDVAVLIPDKVRREISGGGLDGVYLFHNFHFHFTENPLLGAEHLRDGRRYASEIHVVHYSARFSNIREALASRRRDALAVIGVWIDVGSEHAKFPDIFGEVAVEDLKNVNDTVDITPFSLHDVLPMGHMNDFYRYYGSLTAPRYNEVVAWTVVKEPRIVKQETVRHMSQFMYDIDLLTKGPLSRAPQKLYGRVIEKTPVRRHHRRRQRIRLF